MSLITRVDGGALALPCSRYRGVTARVKTRTAARTSAQLPAQTALFADDTAKDPTP